MLQNFVAKIIDVTDSSKVNGEAVLNLFKHYQNVELNLESIKGVESTADFVKIKIKGTNGKSNNGDAPTLGIIGRLGGLGARPNRIGLVSDADGAIAALSSALKLSDMQLKGDYLEGDVIITTHINPNSPIIPHCPVSFMGSSVDMDTMNKYEIDEEMDAIVTIDTTKGNRVINHKGIAITPTIKSGYILKVREDLLDILQNVTGELPFVIPVTTQDITPYGNGLYHLNSILQPSTATDRPVVGLGITTQIAVPGSSTGSSDINDIEKAARFSIEIAKAFGNKELNFYDLEEFDKLVSIYGEMKHIQTQGK